MAYPSVHSSRGFRLVQHGKFTDSTIADFDVKQSTTVKYNLGDLVFTGAPGSQYVAQALPATGNYGTTSDSILGVAVQFSQNELNDHTNFEVYRIRDGQEYEIALKDKTLVTTQAQVNALVGNQVTAHYDATTKAWTLDTAVANAATNLFMIKDINYKDGFARVEIAQ
jgi:hypothetical protein